MTHFNLFNRQWLTQRVGMRLLFVLSLLLAPSAVNAQSVDAALSAADAALPAIDTTIDWLYRRPNELPLPEKPI